MGSRDYYLYINFVQKLIRGFMGVGLTVSEDNVLFIHETYEGNKHDAKIFPELIDALATHL